jgi:transposase InsO family protein
MSLNSEDKVGGGGSGALHLQAPRLLSGGVGYAAWQSNMDVFLQRAGAEGIHRKPMAEADWLSMSCRVEEWAAESLSAALALVGGGATSSTSSSSSSSSALTTEMKDARRLLSATVERSRKVFGMLYSSLPDELRAQVAHVPQGWAYGLWHWLESKFQSTEEDNVGALLSQWTTLRQEEDESFDAYRARVNRLHVLLDQAKEKPSRRMYAFMLLDQLQPRYKQAVLALKAGGQLKDAEKIEWDTVAAFINQHERHELRLSASTSSAEGMTMVAAAHARVGGSSASQSGMGWQKQGSHHGSDRQQPRASRNAGLPQRGGQETRRCFRCDEKGHIAANCTKPPKTGRPDSAAKASPAARMGGEQASSATRAPTGAAAAATSVNNRFESLSSEDEEDEGERSYLSVAATASNSSADRPLTFAEAEARGRNAPKPSSGAAGAATNNSGSRVPQPSKPIQKVAHWQGMRTEIPLDVALADDAWGWDTMASSCCSGNRARFSTLSTCAAVPVKVADGDVVSATHIGSVPLRVQTDSGKVVRIELNNVLFHERFASNLLSGELLTKKLGWQFHSTPKETYVVTPGGSRVTLSTRGRVAVLMGAGLERMYRALIPGAGTESDDAAERLVRLHERLCHMGWTRMMNLLHGGKVLDHGVDIASLSSSTIKTAEKRVRECVACVKGRTTRTAFGHRGLDRGVKPGECMHLDTYQVKVEREGSLVTEYGLLMKDMCSAHVWHARLQSKEQVAERVLLFVSQAETQFGCSVKRLYTDGGTEFINQTLKAFCAKTGKELHWTPARSQQLNGAAERTVRTVKDHARMMMQHAGASVKLWGWAATHAAFVWNRTHISADTVMTPYEAMRGKKPSLKHLSAVWGCDAFCHVPKEQRGSLDAKAEPCVYVGHSEVQNAAHVLLLSTKKIICSRDVSYRSDSFSFMRALELGDDSRRSALETCETDLRAELDEIGDAAEAEEAEEWAVESIVSQRKRNGRMEYKVHWAGFPSDEDTWEPEAEVRDLEAMEVWRAKQPQAEPRRSARNKGAPRAEDELAENEPQVQMAMCALRSLQLPDEQPEHALLKSAVAYGVAALEEQTPQTYRQAMASPDAAKWKAALEKEMQSCVEQKVWTLLPRSSLPKGANVLPCKEVFKIKVDEQGRVVQHKARFTPKGFRQKHGVDFFETYARTGQYKTLRVFLSLMAKWDHELAQFDVPTAFLNAPVEEDIYMELPEGFEQPGMVCKLLKSLYGLRQAPRNWDRLIHAFIMRELGFKATVSDPSLYFKRSRSGRLMMIYRFVDDLMGGRHAHDADEFQENVVLLEKRFGIKMLVNASWMLGMRITRDRKARTITLDQELYTTKALERYGLQQCRTVSTPEAVGAAHDTSPELEEPADKQRYMEITGTLMYAAISTRPDIAHAVHYLASNMQAPTQRHMRAAERVLRYLAGTKEVGLVFGSRNGDSVGDSRGRRAQVQVDVCAFADADWANDKGDRRSISGWVAKINGDAVSWSSKKQRVVALSTCEAELYAESAAIQEVLWLRGLMEELGLHIQTGSIVYGDNQSTLAVSENGIKNGERTKHVDVKYHFVTETVERGAIKLRWIPTTQQQADIFTKALAAPVFELLRKQIMTR